MSKATQKTILKLLVCLNLNTLNFVDALFIK